MTKRIWQEPVVRSIDSCEPIFGDCKVGTSVAPGEPVMQCNTGTGATTSGACTTGNGAKDYCAVGNGVR